MEKYYTLIDFVLLSLRGDRMISQQGSEQKTCILCGKKIEFGRWIMDLFTTTPGRQKSWAHTSCARRAIEIFIVKREQRIKQ